MAANGDLRHRQTNGKTDRRTSRVDTFKGREKSASVDRNASTSDSVFNLFVCVGGIYASLYVIH